MAEDSIFERLITLPLFQGMSRSDLQAITGHTRFDFKKHPQGDVIVEEGTPCQHLHFLLAGSIYVTTEADDHGYLITEDQKAPAIFQLENIFGLNQRFTHTYTAREDCSLMSITKQEVIQLSSHYEIFRFNLLNIISTQTHKNNRRLLRSAPRSLEERITRFFEARCTRPAGEKTIAIKMTRLAEEMNTKRIYTSNALHKMQDKGLLQLSRGKIYIPALEKLLLMRNFIK